MTPKDRIQPDWNPGDPKRLDPTGSGSGSATLQKRDNFATQCATELRLETLIIKDQTRNILGNQLKKSSKTKLYIRRNLDQIKPFFVKTRNKLEQKRYNLYIAKNNTFQNWCNLEQTIVTNWTKLGTVLYKRNDYKQTRTIWTKVKTI